MTASARTTRASTGPAAPTLPGSTTQPATSSPSSKNADPKQADPKHADPKHADPKHSPSQQLPPADASRPRATIPPDKPNPRDAPWMVVVCISPPPDGGEMHTISGSPR